MPFPDLNVDKQINGIILLTIRTIRDFFKEHLLNFDAKDIETRSFFGNSYTNYKCNKCNSRNSYYSHMIASPSQPSYSH